MKPTRIHTLEIDSLRVRRLEIIDPTPGGSDEQRLTAGAARPPANWPIPTWPVGCFFPANRWAHRRRRHVTVLFVRQTHGTHQ